MRRFLIENRRTITAIIVIILAIIMSRYILVNMSAPEKRIVSNNKKIVFNNSSMYLKNVKIEGITDAQDFNLRYTYIDINDDSKNEIILEYSGNSNFDYYIINNSNNRYIMSKIPENIDILNMKENKNILSEKGELYLIKYENFEWKQERLAYIDETSENAKYVVNGEGVSKFSYNKYIKENYEDVSPLHFIMSDI